MAYLPFGEVLFEEHSSSFSSPNLFNGKELDRETNMTYYSARYLDMKTSLWLNRDRYSENDLSVGSYVYSFNNPINFIDPDGNWPDLPSWKDVKKSYNEAKITVSRTYKEARSSVARTYNETKESIAQTRDNAIKSTNRTLDRGQKWVKENKKEILNVANNIQDAGDAIAISGYGAAVVGAPIAGVGAAPGAFVATVGNGIGLFGSGIEIITNLIAEDYGASGKEAGFVVGGLVIDAVVDRILPGPTPNISKEATTILKEGINVKTIVAERMIKNSQEDKK